MGAKRVELRSEKHWDAANRCHSPRPGRHQPGVVKIPRRLLVGFLAAWLSGCAGLDDPKTALKAYFAALSRADRQTANQLTARFPKFGLSDVSAVTEQYIQLHKQPGYGPVIRGSKAIENCAVVIAFESPTDPDPIYLIRQEEAWRVLPTLTEFDQDRIELRAPELARFRELEAWYRSQVGKSTPAGPESFKDATIKDTSRLARLLDAGLDPNVRSPDAYQEPLLWRAVRLGQPQTVRLLLDRGARVDERSAVFKKTALFQAAFDGSLEIAKLLIGGGADPNALDIFDNNPLREAILAKRTAMVRFLREHGTDPNQVNKDGESMKAIALEHGTIEMQAILADKDGGQPESERTGSGSSRSQTNPTSSATGSGPSP